MKSPVAARPPQLQLLRPHVAEKRTATYQNLGKHKTIKMALTNTFFSFDCCVIILNLLMVHCLLCWS